MEHDIFTFPARVHRIQDADQRSALMERLKRIALDDAVLDEHPPFFWAAEISNGNLDSYFSRMHESSLQNYARDAETGVSFLLGHNRRTGGIGRSLTGSYADGRVTADFYTLPGYSIGGESSDDVIRGIRSGILSDVSIGFHGGREVCDICKTDYFSWDCPHLAGMNYPDQETQQDRIATYTIHDARLVEVSAVYDGATPGATILKAERMIREGDLSPADIRAIETKLRVRLPQPQKQFRGADVPGERNDEMDPKEQLVQIRSLFGLAPEANVVSELESVQTELADLRDRVADLEPLADDGRTYRAELIDDAVRHGVRAHGDAFNEEGRRKMLESVDLATVREFRDSWKQLGDARFAGGRKTRDGEDPVQPQTETAPAAAYKA